MGASNKNTKTIQFRALTDEDYNKMVEKANAEGLSVSQWSKVLAYQTINRE